MRLLQRCTVALFVLVLLAYAGLTIYTHTSVDRVPPVITCDSDVVEVRVGAPDSAFLKGVTASDNKDGDLTGEVMIKGITQLITGNTAKITYIAFDSSNNMTTATRTVRYTNYEKPRFALDRPLIYLVGSQIKLLDRLSATDVIDGDISDHIRITTQNVDASRAGVYSVTVQAANSLGDVESLPLKVVVSNAMNITPTVQLSAYITYLDVGENFNPRSYITSPADPAAVSVESHVDISTPGTYDVTYTYQTDTVYQTVVVR